MGKKKRSTKIYASAIIVTILIFGCMAWFLSSHSSENSKTKTTPDNAEEATVPTPTQCPDAALPSLWMNGKLYKVDPIEEKEAVFEEEDFIGAVESNIGYNKMPTKELEANTLDVGTSLYKHRDLEDTYIGIYRRSGLVYYYEIFEYKK